MPTPAQQARQYRKFHGQKLNEANRTRLAREQARIEAQRAANPELIAEMEQQAAALHDWCANGVRSVARLRGMRF